MSGMQEQYKRFESTVHSVQFTGDDNTFEEIRRKESIKWHGQVQRGECRARADGNAAIETVRKGRCGSERSTILLQEKISVSLLLVSFSFRQCQISAFSIKSLSVLATNRY